ncbi:MAG: NAD(P)-dependent oxidoreductase, partial [Pseudomonadota bacterium]
VLDHFQRGPERRAAQAEAAWRPLPFREVMGSVWLIVGFGAVGQAVAARARGFGARIIGVRRDQAAHPLADTLASPAAMTGLLPTAAVVVLSAPLSAATRHMADAAFFAAMKAESVLVNVGRGALADEAALLEALSRGRPAHAVLDVFETEPLPPGHPFWRHGRIALTAHASGMTGGQDVRNEALFLDNLGRFMAGEPLLGEADPRDVLAS